MKNIAIIETGSYQGVLKGWYWVQLTYCGAIERYCEFQNKRDLKAMVKKLKRDYSLKKVRNGGNQYVY